MTACQSLSRYISLQKCNLLCRLTQFCPQPRGVDLGHFCLNFPAETGTRLPFPDDRSLSRSEHGFVNAILLKTAAMQNAAWWTLTTNVRQTRTYHRHHKVSLYVCSKTCWHQCFKMCITWQTAIVMLFHKSCMSVKVLSKLSTLYRFTHARVHC
jgi:hypothetical protein